MARVPRLDNLAVSAIPDQIGQPQLVILGVDAHGEIWIKQGDMPWRKVSRVAERESSTGRELP